MRALTFVLSLFLLAHAHVARAASDKVAVPYLTGPVVDEAQLLSPEDRARVQVQIEKLNASGRIQLAILIAQSLQGFDIESYSISVAENWKLGKKKEDRGLIFVIAPNERKMRLEVGYGLEGELTDAMSRRILDEVVAPYFKVGRYRDGLLVGIEAIAQHVGVDLTAPVDGRLSSTHSKLKQNVLYTLILLVFLIYFLVGSWLFPGPRRGGWGGGGWGGGGGFGGGGFGGGGFSGGGGGFGGGGASSSW